MGAVVAGQDAMAFADESGLATPLIRQFAAHPLFCSATVDELEREGDFYRRPLRPPDLDFVDFSRPVTAGTVCHLPSLSAQRILRCIYDLNVVQLPTPDSAASVDRHRQFYNDANRTLAARIAPFLERFAFGFLEGPDDPSTSAQQCQAAFEDTAREAAAFADRVAATFLGGGFAEEALRFLLVQKGCLAPSKRTALVRAEAAGHFDLIAPQDRLGANGFDDAQWKRLALQLGMTGGPHTYWQFYLPTSLAEANYLDALARRPECWLRLLGAAFAADADGRAFVRVIREAGGEPAQTEYSAARISRTVCAVEERFGTYGLRETLRGLRAAQRLAQAARRDLERQLRWLASIDRYAVIAKRIDERIRLQRPDIDRDTFVEPREMCSTTHVHDDHRLVVIETGRMVFWANPGMRFRMAPGDMVLVPEGRLHGSAVESDECIYHQPIIPDEWVRPLVDEVDAGLGWARQ